MSLRDDWQLAAKHYRAKLVQHIDGAPPRCLSVRKRRTLMAPRLADGNCLLAYCVPASTLTSLSTHTPSWGVKDTKCLRIGPAWFKYVFDKMELAPVWKCRRPAYDYKDYGATLFLFKFADVGIWLCAHGPTFIDDYNQFLAALDAGKLTPVWASWDRTDITAQGMHSWDTFDNETRTWVGENFKYETTRLQLPDTDVI